MSWGGKGSLATAIESSKIDSQDMFEGFSDKVCQVVSKAPSHIVTSQTNLKVNKARVFHKLSISGY